MISPLLRSSHVRAFYNLFPPDGTRVIQPMIKNSSTLDHGCTERGSHYEFQGFKYTEARLPIASCKNVVGCAPEPEGPARKPAEI